MYRFVFSWRWIRLHVLIWLILIPAFISLGMWQESRYHERRAENAVLRAAIDGAPVPLASLDGVGATIPKSQRWHQVTVTGVYDTAHQYLARNRQQGGNPGFYVVTPLVAADGTAVLVNRGWIPTTTSGDEQASPPIPAAPAGQVTLVGRLQPAETKSSTGIRDITAGLPAGQISLINTRALAEGTGLTLRGGYVERISSTPADSPSITVLDAPSLDEGPYLAYWFQWWLFGGIAVGAWAMIIRREAQHRAAEAAGEDDADEDGDGDGDYEAGVTRTAGEDEEDGETAAPETPGGEEAAAAEQNKPGSAALTEPVL